MRDIYKFDINLKRYSTLAVARNLQSCATRFFEVINYIDKHKKFFANMEKYDIFIQRRIY